MTWQSVAAVLVVAAAVLYLAWKIGLSPGSARKKRGPDVPASKLVRKRK